MHTRSGMNAQAISQQFEHSSLTLNDENVASRLSFDAAKWPLICHQE